MTDATAPEFDESPTMFGTSPGWFIIWCLLTPVLIGIFGFLIWRFQLSRTRLTIQGQRIIYRTGITSTRESEIRVNDVRDIEITRTFFQKMAGTGVLSLSTSGENGMEIQIAGLNQPERVREIVHALRT
jgi:uncharacterized membrane protein YdbT with pleckstrin-like domain